MRHGLGGMVLLLACLAGSAADRPADKPLKAQYDALVKQYREAQNAFFPALSKAKTPQDRARISKEIEGKLEKVRGRLVELAEKHPKNAIALDALVSVAQDNLFPRGKARTRAIELLARDHVRSSKLVPLCQSLTNSHDRQSETLLRAVLAGNPSKTVRAEACLALTQDLSRRASDRRLVEDEDLSKRFEVLFGKETLAELKRSDPAKLDEEGEKLARRFVDEYLGEVRPDRLVSLCERLRFSPDKGSEVLLRALLKHDSRAVQGVACLTLAQVLKQRAADKDEKKAAGLRGESEKLFTRAADKYADVKAGFRGTVGETARNELYEIRHLAVGKPAPVVEGEDQDGKKFKLGDSKGKVVLLDFWSQY